MSDPLSRGIDGLSVPPALQLAHTEAGLNVWVSSSAPRVRVTPIHPAVVLIGDVYAANSGFEGASPPFDLASLADLRLEAMCSRLVDSAWGRYVLISHAGQLAGAFRDPSGALDCVTWLHSDLRLFAGRLPHELDFILPGDLSLDWTVVARQLDDPSAVSGPSALSSIDAIAPGALWTSGPGASGRVEPVWRPSGIARRGLDLTDDPVQLLRTRVKASVATLTQGRQRIVSEISGGLDSAIVASALCDAARRHDPPAQDVRWINYATDEPEGDERLFARAVASKLGIELTERHRVPLRYKETTLAQVGADFRVGLTALDPEYDSDIADQASDYHADMLVTGQGGDVVFLQMATNEALSDRLRGEGRLGVAELLGHSRRWRRSIWQTLGSTIGGAVWPKPRRRRERPYLSQTTTSTNLSHPWLADGADLPPAKAAQVRALVASQNVFGPCRRGCVVPTIHPLLSQPVVELTLALPTYVLTRGGEDRALARAAFADALPQVLRDRRSKGSMQAFYGRAVADSLEVLRPWLLDGLLARQGLIKIDRLEPLLDPDVLLMKDVYVDLLHIAAVEGWVRGWSSRIEAIRSRRDGETS